MLNGFFHSGLVFFVPLYVAAESQSLTDNGHNHDLWSISITSFSCIIVVVSIKLIMYTKIWNWVHFVVLGFCSIFPYFAFIFIYDFITETPAYLTMNALASSYYFYFNIIATGLIVIVLDGGLYFARRSFWPTKSEIL
mmetsp:Transcript_12095/g.1817  ORF Transcript_12095/g.1817 Transcript_12095/m.1817 type:complete len:138 (+) Transcript_12095:886-1299(+)